jgi:hypothetical protein
MCKGLWSSCRRDRRVNPSTRFPESARFRQPRYGQPLRRTRGAVCLKPSAAKPTPRRRCAPRVRRLLLAEHVGPEASPGPTRVCVRCLHAVPPCARVSPLLSPAALASVRSHPCNGLPARASVLCAERPPGCSQQERLDPLFAAPSLRWRALNDGSCHPRRTSSGISQGVLLSAR